MDKMENGGGFNGRYPFGWRIPKPGGPDPLPEDEIGGTLDYRWPK